MEWWLLLLVIFGAFFLLLAAGLPVAFSFWLINIIGAILIWGGEKGLHMLTTSMYTSISSWAFLPLPMFVLLGEVLFQSGVVVRAVDVVDRWLRRLPGSLAFVAVVAGALVGALSGASIASASLLGSTLLPDMQQRGYKPAMTVGPIMGGGSLAPVIPPSGFAVLIACLAEISVGKLLISGVIPGLMLAGLFAIYIIIRCLIQPSLAPSYVLTPAPLSEKIRDTVYWVLPLGVIILVVTGLIFLGIATPTESAAMGALAAFVMMAFYRRLNWSLIKKCHYTTLPITIMIMLILTGSAAFSQILAYTGATAKMIELAIAASVPPVMLVIIMQFAVLVMGCFMESISILMITVPIFFPVIKGLGLNPIWFGLLMLISIETGLITPPFGILLFVMKGLVPPNISFGKISRAALPFVLCNTLGIAIIIAFPIIGLWLPSFMRY